MARQKIEAPRPFASWEEADEALRQIGEAQRAIEAAEHTMQEAIDLAKEAAAAASLPYRELIRSLEPRLNVFCDLRREDMGARKSIELNYGVLGYRKSTKVVLPRGAAKVAEIINKLRGRGMTDCIITPAARIDKDALKKYPPNDIIDVGASLDVQDTFWYEVKREELAE
jgi:phage host-nuclease inhibitor protein Gam